MVSCVGKLPAMNTTPNSPALECLAVTAAELAKQLNISERHVWSLHSSGRIPLPVRIGGSRSVRWRVAEIRAWLDAGCPVRATWEANRGGA